MTNTFQNRVIAVTLALLTLAACVLAGFNLRSEDGYSVPTDGGAGTGRVTGGASGGPDGRYCGCDQ